MDCSCRPTDALRPLCPACYARVVAPTPEQIREAWGRVREDYRRAVTR